VADVVELIGDSSLTMPTFQNDDGMWIEEALKTEEVERTGGKAKEPDPC